MAPYFHSFFYRSLKTEQSVENIFLNQISPISLIGKKGAFDRDSSRVFWHITNSYHVSTLQRHCNLINHFCLLFDLEATTSLGSFAPDASSIASSIKYHAEFTPLFSPEKFELPQAFFATAQSVRDALIINWNATNDYYEKLNVKQAYYLSMEFLQVRCYHNHLNTAWNISSI